MWAYERGHDDIVTLLKHYRRSDDDYARGDYTPSGLTLAMKLKEFQFQALTMSSSMGH